jgi:predicted aconitase
MGARTNRTPFGLDICAAITGRVPEFGLYLDDNRAGTVLFEVQAGELSDLDFHTLGALIGVRSGTEIPVIRGLSAHVTNDQLKCLGAAAASAGSVALYHVLGITPEARLADPFQEKKPSKVHTITRKDLVEMEESITTTSAGEEVDMVTIGCPLLSIEELRNLCRKMHCRKVKRNVHFWVYLANDTYDHGKVMGLVQPLEKNGVWFSTQTCATISPIKAWQFSHIMTNSAKCALVIPSEHNVKVTYRDTDGCILAATEPV